MAELYLRLAFGELPEIAPQERFGDIGSEETYLVREVDNEPEVLTADQIRSRYEDLTQASSVSHLESQCDAGTGFTP